MRMNCIPKLKITMNYRLYFTEFSTQQIGGSVIAFNLVAVLWTVKRKDMIWFATFLLQVFLLV